MGIVAAYAVPHPPLIIPAVGRGEEQGIQATIDAYQEVARRIAAFRPDTVVITSPHAPYYRDGFFISDARSAYGDMSRFRAPQERLSVDCDVELSHRLISLAKRGYKLPVIGSGVEREELDHATYIPLYFIRDLLSSVRLLRIGLSMLPAQTHYDLGQAIRQAVEELDRRVVFIASGDLSHKLLAEGPYGFAPEGPVFDQAIAEIFSSGKLSELFDLDSHLCEQAAECGLRSFWIMAGAIDGLGFSSSLLSHEGPFGVGYAVAAFESTKSQAPSESDPYVDLARAGVEAFVRTGAPLARPDDLPDALLTERAGVFVSLHKGDDLRGCIGTILPTCDCVADEIIRNAVAASSEDPRFSPVREDELDYLSYSVDILEKPEPINSEDDLDPKRYGVIVTKGWHRGLLLPNLDGVDTVADQVFIAKRKAGLSPYERGVALERFEVTRHSQGGEARKRLSDETSYEAK